MRKLISRLTGSFYRYRQLRRWKKEAAWERRSITPNSSIEHKFDGKCMILIPHSDDEWIGCSRVMLSGQEVLLCNMDMNGGDSDALHKERYNEMNSVADLCKRRLITITQDKSNNLARAIEDYNPDYVFLPHFIDWHPEHKEVMRLLRSALQKCSCKLPHVAMYQVSCPIIANVTHALPMTKEDCKMKWSFFKSHYPTQLHIPYQRFCYNEVINGKYVGAYAAEVYVEIEMGDWLSALEKKLPDESQTEELRNNLGSISSMRRFITSELAGH